MSTPESHSAIDDPWDNPLHERHKTRPVYADVDYPHYADLNDFIKRYASDAVLTILDYGAGASPYRKYFPNADYRRADITKTATLKYQIRSDSTVPEADSTFDLILSTQVAEHVPNPEVYFGECYRLLKPGGRLVLTTHGIWEEHGSPYDFQRWTPNGLERDLIKAGFVLPSTFKITCGLRGMFLFFTRILFATLPPTKFGDAAFFKFFRLLYSKAYPLLYRLADNWWPNDKIVQTRKGDPNPIWYVVLAAVAQK